MIAAYLESIYYEMNHAKIPTLMKLVADLREALLCQRDEVLVVWESNPEPHWEQSLHGGDNERGVGGITISLLLHLPRFMVVQLSVQEA